MEVDKEYGGFFRNELTINDIQATMVNFIHVFFGISFHYFFILIADSRSILTHYNGGDLYVIAASALAAFLFWGMDETLRRR